MKRSADRILATHVGSLPRPPELSEAGPAEQDEVLRSAVGEVVRRQAEIGLDVVCDGELGKPSFVHYVNDRLGGFEPTERIARGPFAGSRETQSFPEYYARHSRANPNPAANAVHMVCTGPISYVGHESLRRDLDNLAAALEDVEVEEAFVPAISPGNVEEWQSNGYYASDEEFLLAIADALAEEYRAIVDAGFLLQVDDPRLASYYALNPDASIEDCRRWIRLRVEALNHALEGIPPERVRYHTCYSINIGPRLHDMELEHIVDLMLEVNAGAYSFEAANSRHEHEWRVWERIGVPDGKILIPGVVTNSNVMIEHPDAVADRIVRFAEAAGRENVIAGADCGFASFAGNHEIDPEIAWAKLEAVAEGARRAGERLWS